MKKVLLLILLLACLMPLCAQAEPALRGWDAELGYQYVRLGEYPYEAEGTVRPVLWRVLGVEDNKALLMTEEIIDTFQVVFIDNKRKAEDKQYPRIFSYEESDLYPHMNTVVLDTLLGDDPIREALIEEPGSGLLFLLDEMSLSNTDYGFPYYRTDSETSRKNMTARMAKGTPYAVSRGLFQMSTKVKNASPYWVPDKCRPYSYWMGIVSADDGHISWAEWHRKTWPDEPNKKKGIGVRPCLRVDLTNVTIKHGAGSMEMPFALAYAQDKSVGIATPEPAAEPSQESGEASDEDQAVDATVVPPAMIPSATAEEIEEAPAEEAEQPTKQPTERPTKAPTPEPTEEPTPEPTEAPAGDGSITLSFVGDCSIGDSYQFKAYGTSYHTVLAEQGYDWPFSLVKKYLEADDLTVANLEVVLTNLNSHTGKMYNLVGDPQFAQVLIEGGIEVVNTVNNHAMDFFADGYADTVKTLDEAGVGHFGSINLTRKDGGFDHLYYQDVGDLRIGFVGFTYPQIQAQETKEIVPRIQKLKEEHGCDLVVVSVHWGKEESNKPVSSQYKTAKLLIDGGADVVWGHHPHVIQPIELYNGKPVFYSTGNFTFGTMSQVDPATGIFQLTYRKVDGVAEIQRLEVIPCQTQYAPDYRPFELTDPEARQKVFRKLWQKQRNVPGYVSLPESFLETGIVEFENGQMVP